MNKTLLLKALELLKEEIDSLKRIIDDEVHAPQEIKEEYQEEVLALEEVQTLIEKTIRDS